MPLDQRAEVTRTPPRWLIPWITTTQVWVYEITRGRLGASAKNMQNLLLRGIRRKSGKKFAVCLPYWLDDDGRRIVVASYAGARKNPAWYHNVKDTRANPKVTVRDGARVFAARVEILEGDEYERLWERICADRPFYARYQGRTSRRIPLVRILDTTA
ncbi:MAG: nitroreductase/quinone reductase family protein [Candidatus Binatia bacterium]|nr:nitroreductase/quinone reductase family protein [Candidatus Binatia bacterium]